MERVKGNDLVIRLRIYLVSSVKVCRDRFFWLLEQFESMGLPMFPLIPSTVILCCWWWVTNAVVADEKHGNDLVLGETEPHRSDPEPTVGTEPWPETGDVDEAPPMPLTNLFEGQCELCRGDKLVETFEFEITVFLPDGHKVGTVCLA